MKKLLLVSAVLLGAITASQAGVHLNIGIPLPPLPLPPLPGIVIGRPAPRDYSSYDAPRDYYQAPPDCYDSRVVVAPPIVRFGFGSDGCYGSSYGYRGRDSHYYSYRGGDHRGWDRRGGSHRGGHDDGHHRR